MKSSRPRGGLEEDLSWVDCAVKFELGFDVDQAFNYGLVRFGGAGME